MKKTNLLLSLALLGASLVLSACNTSRGFGEDVEELGEEVQEAAD
jgi:predicted small secreted protein